MCRCEAFVLSRLCFKRLAGRCFSFLPSFLPSFLSFFLSNFGFAEKVASSSSLACSFVNQRSCVLSGVRLAWLELAARLSSSVSFSSLALLSVRSLVMKKKTKNEVTLFTCKAQKLLSRAQKLFLRSLQQSSPFRRHLRGGPLPNERFPITCRFGHIIPPIVNL